MVGVFLGWGIFGVGYFWWRWGGEGQFYLGRHFLLTAWSFFYTVVFLLAVVGFGLLYLWLKFGLVFFACGEKWFGFFITVPPARKWIWSFFTSGSPTVNSKDKLSVRRPVSKKTHSFYRKRSFRGIRQFI